MPVYRITLGIYLDTTDPVGAMYINPVFNDQGVGTDPEGLANDILDGYTAWMAPQYRGAKMSAKVVDAQGTKPVYPVAYVERNPTSVVQSAVNREVACCLSFYAQSNVKRRRGRVYVPFLLTASTLDAKTISSTARDKIGALAGMFADLGGVDVDWSVYSKVDNQVRAVTDWWVDDGWDTIRSRTLKSTARTKGTTSEALALWESTRAANES